jgi:hypothetical protein
MVAKSPYLFKSVYLEKIEGQNPGRIVTLEMTTCEMVWRSEEALDATEDLRMAMSALDTAATPKKKIVAGRAVVRAYLIDGLYRKQEGGALDMICTCGKQKSYGIGCLKCKYYRHALYGGKRWVRTGICHSRRC